MNNIPLLIVDIIFLPITLMRLFLIYLFGSKYNIKGFSFLDVILHADSPYFNQEDSKCINTLKDDFRVVIRDDSRLFNIDLKKAGINNNVIKILNNTDKQNTSDENTSAASIRNDIVIGTTFKDKSVWDMDHHQNNKNKINKSTKKLKKNINSEDINNILYSHQNHDNIKQNKKKYNTSSEEYYSDTDNSDTDSTNSYSSVSTNYLETDTPKIEPKKNHKNRKTNVFNQNVSKKEFDELLSKVSDKIIKNSENDVKGVNVFDDNNINNEMSNDVSNDISKDMIENNKKYVDNKDSAYRDVLSAFD